MMDTPVFVFENGCPDYVGLSVQQDGSNLPKTCTSRYDWRPTNRVATSPSALRGLTIDVELALLNLRTRGYHIGRTSAVVLNFPHSAQSSL